MSYTISQAAEKMNLTAHTLRYYDKEGLLPFVERGPGGVRKFTEKDLGWIRLINCLKASGLSIKEIYKYIEWYRQGDATLTQRRDLFCARKAAVVKEMAELQATLDTLNYKCWAYNKAVELGRLDAVHQIPPEQIPPDILIAKARLVEG